MESSPVYDQTLGWLQNLANVFSSSSEFSRRTSLQLSFSLCFDLRECLGILLQNSINWTGWTIDCVTEVDFKKQPMRHVVSYCSTKLMIHFLAIEFALNDFQCFASIFQVQCRLFSYFEWYHIIIAWSTSFGHVPFNQHNQCLIIFRATLRNPQWGSPLNDQAKKHRHVFCGCHLVGNISKMHFVENLFSLTI